MRRKKDVNEVDFRTLFEEVPGLYLILLPDLRIAAVNDAYASATMTKREEILGRALFEIFPDNPDDPEADGVSNLRSSLDYVRKYRKAHAMAIQKYDIRRADGTFEVRYWSPLNKPVLDEQGEISYIIHRVEDVTEFIFLQQDKVAKDKITEDLRTRVEEMQAKIVLRSKELEKLNTALESMVEERTRKLAASEKQYRETLDNMLEGAQIIGFDWRYMYVNNTVEKQGRLPRQELIGYTMMQKYPGIEDTEMFGVLKKCMTDRVSQFLETEFVFPDGASGWFQLSIQPVPDGIFILSLDITERKSAEEKTRKYIKEISDYKYALDESAIFAVTDHKGIITHVNENFCRISKYSAEELIGKDHRIINSGHHPKEFIKKIWTTIAKGEVWKGELKNKAKDGTIYWVDTTIVPFLNGDGKPYQYVAIRSDITQRKRYEEELLKLNESLEQKVNERTSQLTAVNAELQTYIQLVRENEEKYRTLFDSIDEGYCIIEMIFDKKKKPVDYRFLVVNRAFERQTGLSDAVGKRMREFAPNHEEYWFETYGKIALTGESVRFENRAEQLNRWYDVYAFRFGDPQNFQVAILFNDISERKKTEEQLVAVNKELEAFSYSVSHDLRAPLRAINGFANILQEDYGQILDAEGNRLLGVVQDSAGKMGVLIDDLLAFSRLGRKSVQKTKVDMKRLAETTLQELNKATRHNASIYIAELHPALSDYTLMNQVFVNLFSNAIKYSSKVPMPQIEIRSVQKEDEVVYSVKDNGAGFDMQYAHKLFGVFQRLHKTEEFEGTGVGLAIVQRIIHKHGGKIWADSQPGKGATFYFSLPLN